MLLDSAVVHRSFEVFLQLRNDEHGRCERQQEDDVHAREAFGLKDHLEWREINHQQLANEREADGSQEHLVGEESNLCDGTRISLTL